MDFISSYRSNNRRFRQKNDNILKDIHDILGKQNSHMLCFKLSIKTHLSIWSNISSSVLIIYDEKMEDTEKFLINGLGSIFKSISGNLYSSDREYYTEYINKINED